MRPRRWIRSRVRPREPAAQLMRGFFRRRAIERHQRGRPARNAHEIRTPAVTTDRGHLDEEFATVDDFFETMCIHVSIGEKGDASF